MTVVAKSALMEYSAEDMFNLVDDVESYPQFLPWCSNSKLIARTAEKTSATLSVNYKGAKTKFSTENHKVSPERMDIHLLKGPFRNFHGHWRFTSLSARACQIELYLEYEFQSGFFANRLFAPVFGYLTNTLLDAFVQRAHQVYAAPLSSQGGNPHE